MKYINLFRQYMDNNGGDGGDGAGAGDGGSGDGGDGQDKGGDGQDKGGDGQDKGGDGQDKGGDGGDGQDKGGDGQDKGGDGGSADPAAWSEQRKQIAGDNEAMLNDMSRYESMEKWIESGWSAKQTIRKGEVSTGLPDDASDEQVAAFREANGIPNEATGYSFEGLEMTETDTRVMGAVSQVAHQYNISNEALSALTEAHLVERDAIIGEMDAQDGMDQKSCEKVLKDNWKTDYEANMGAVESFLNGLPEDIRKDVMESRTGSGKALMNSPEFVQFLTDSALKINPMAAIPGGGDNPVGTADEVIRQVQKMFSEGKEETYYKDNQLQKNYEAALGVYQSMNKEVPKFH